MILLLDVAENYCDGGGSDGMWSKGRFIFAYVNAYMVLGVGNIVLACMLNIV